MQLSNGIIHIQRLSFRPVCRQAGLSGIIYQVDSRRCGNDSIFSVHPFLVPLEISGLKRREKVTTSERQTVNLLYCGIASYTRLVLFVMPDCDPVSRELKGLDSPIKSGNDNIMFIFLGPLSDFSSMRLPVKDKITD